jgi:hypothetical protein
VLNPGSKIRFWMASGIPGPSSSTTILTPFGLPRVLRTEIRPSCFAFRMASAAFFSRFSTVQESSSGSLGTRGRAGSSSTTISTFRPREGRRRLR